MARNNSISLSFLGIATVFPTVEPAEKSIQYPGNIKSIGIALGVSKSNKMEFCGRVKFWGIGITSALESTLTYQIY